jgi:hypothetical protein
MIYPEAVHEANYDSLALLSFLAKLKVINKWGSMNLGNDTLMPVDLATLFRANRYNVAVS